MQSTFIHHSPLDDASTSFTIAGTLEACSSTTEEQKGQEVTSLESPIPLLSLNISTLCQALLNPLQPHVPLWTSIPATI